MPPSAGRCSSDLAQPSAPPAATARRSRALRPQAVEQPAAGRDQRQQDDRRGQRAGDASPLEPGHDRFQRVADEHAEHDRDDHRLRVLQHQHQTPAPSASVSAALRTSIGIRLRSIAARGSARVGASVGPAAECGDGLRGSRLQLLALQRLVDRDGGLDPFGGGDDDELRIARRVAGDEDAAARWCRTACRSSRCRASSSAQPSEMARLDCGCCPVAKKARRAAAARPRRRRMRVQRAVDVLESRDRFGANAMPFRSSALADRARRSGVPCVQTTTSALQVFSAERQAGGVCARGRTRPAGGRATPSRRNRDNERSTGRSNRRSRGSAGRSSTTPVASRR